MIFFYMRLLSHLEQELYSFDDIKTLWYNKLSEIKQMREFYE